MGITCWEGVRVFPDGVEHFFLHPNGQFLALGGSERLSRCFLHVLAHFGNVKKQSQKFGSKKVLHSANLTEGGGV